MIPSHLAYLSRDDQGLPVTWASAWSDETSRPPRVAFDPLLPDHPRAIFTDGCQFVGEPDNAAPNVQRTRQCVLEQLCQVCGQPVDELIVASLASGWARLRVDGRMVPLLIDAWTCGRCLPYALTVCPYLTARTAPLRVLKVRDWLPVPTPERPKYITGDVLPYGPIGFVKIAILNAVESVAS